MTEQQKLIEVQGIVNYYASIVGLKACPIVTKESGKYICATAHFKSNTISVTRGLLRLDFQNNLANLKYLHTLMCHEIAHIVNRDSYVALGSIPFTKCKKVMHVLTESRADIQAIVLVHCIGSQGIFPLADLESIKCAFTHADYDEKICKSSGYLTREGRIKVCLLYMTTRDILKAYRLALNMCQLDYNVTNEELMAHISSNKTKVGVKEDKKGNWYSVWYKQLGY